MENLKQWIDKGFLLHNKFDKNYVSSLRKTPDEYYRFFYGTTLEDCTKIYDKDWDSFINKVSKFLKDNGIEL